MILWAAPPRSFCSAAARFYAQKSRYFTKLTPSFLKFDKKRHGFPKIGKIRAGLLDILVSGKGEQGRTSTKDGTRSGGSTGYSAEEVLILLKDVLLRYLEELKDARMAGEDSFVYGEQTAYTECLEFIRLWERAAEHGLDFEIEERYPL